MTMTFTCLNNIIEDYTCTSVFLIWMFITIVPIVNKFIEMFMFYLVTELKVYFIVHFIIEEQLSTGMSTSHSDEVF